jgi:UDP-galactopyranose mutase
MPLSRQSLSRFFRADLTPEEARRLVDREAEPFARVLAGPPSNFEEAALSSIGRRLYEAF